LFNLFIIISAKGYNIIELLKKNNFSMKFFYLMNNVKNRIIYLNY